MADVLRTAADELLVSQNELSRRTGITQPTISRTFAGASVFSIDQAEAVCDALGLSLLAVIREAMERRR